MHYASIPPTPSLARFVRPRPALVAWLSASLLGLVGCEENHITNNYYVSEAGATDPSDPAASPDGGSPGQLDPDAGSPEPAADAGADSGSEPTDPDPADGGEGDGGITEPRPFMEGAPEANTALEDFEVDLFGNSGNRFWFAVDPAQVELMNGGQNGGPIIFNEFGDIYTPGGEGGGKTYVESLFVTTPQGQTADYGKIQVRLIGQSTYRPWTRTTLPNLRLNMDGFTEGLRLDGYEHVRFNNALVGNIFREKLTLQIYRALGYPAPKATYAWVGSNTWGPDVWIPYVLVEVYKKGFCEQWSEQFGGSCVNMWEFYGDFGQGLFADPNNCQADECDNTRALELDSLVASTLPGPGFKDALAEWIDWDSFHQFQCLSWILATGDDPLHNMNNLVLVEREDGKFQYLPYSVDISLGQEWYPQVSLTGTNTLANGCQNDEACWADTIATCEDLLERFVELDPQGLLDDNYADLQAQGMLRDGDEGRYELLKIWFEDRLMTLPIELEENREVPQTCVYPYVMCGDVCMLEYDCYNQCVPPVIGEPEPLPVPEPRPGARVAGDAGDAGNAADVVIAPEPLPVDPDAGAVPPDPGPVECPPIEVYKLAH